MKKEFEAHYRIIAQIGEGTFSQVFKAFDQQNGELVALKRVKIRKAEDGIPAEFIREVESLSRL
jgi:serine/threonine protein kinase